MSVNYPNAAEENIGYSAKAAGSPQSLTMQAITSIHERMSGLDKLTSALAAKLSPVLDLREQSIPSPASEFPLRCALKYVSRRRPCTAKDRF